ncbi:MAG: glycosyltransferase 87 family protein [Patescibacteria group bacterium]
MTKNNLFSAIKNPKIIIVLLILIIASIQRVQLFYQIGGDSNTYINAVTDFIEGENPYKNTVASFNNLDSDPGNKGFAYLPGLLYLNSFLMSLFLYVNKAAFPCDQTLHLGVNGCVPLNYFWKIPVLLADLGIGILLVKELYKKNYLALIFSLLFWYINPFIYLKRDYITSDPIPMFFMMLALFYLKKDDVISGASYALAIAFKSFPVLLFPLFLLKSKSKVKFLTAGFIIALVMSIPFMTSFDNFWTYIQGSLLVHGHRFVQGRPLLYYISYYYKVELFRIISFETYTYLSTFFGWLLILLFYATKLSRNKYFLSLLSFASFYVFTPVLNRTYMLWFIPILLLGLYHVFFEAQLFQKYAKHKQVMFYMVLLTFWGFYYWYLAQWNEGFHIWHP